MYLRRWKLIYSPMPAACSSSRHTVLRREGVYYLINCEKSGFSFYWTVGRGKTSLRTAIDVSVPAVPSNRTFQSISSILLGHFSATGSLEFRVDMVGKIELYHCEEHVGQECRGKSLGQVGSTLSRGPLLIVGGPSSCML